MPDFIEERVKAWSDKECRETNLRLHYLEDRLFSTYVQFFPPNAGFWRRLASWIKNANGDDHLERQLFKSINNIFYIGPDEFNELYRQAYNRSVSRWLIDLNKIGFTNVNQSKNMLLSEVSSTWFCPVSDSLKIGDFYHLNSIPTPADLRPDWRTLSKLGDNQAIRTYIQNHKIKYIVLLEDFVGGGSQMSEAVDYIQQFTDLVSVLIVPLVVCPAGTKNISQKVLGTSMRYDPVLELSSECFISQMKDDDEKEYITQLREMANRTYLSVTNGQEAGKADFDGVLIKPYYPLGWDQTGGLVVMHTNTPDNTLPMFHWSSESWSAIFPRHSRN